MRHERKIKSLERKIAMLTLGKEIPSRLTCFVRVPISDLYLLATYDFLG